MTGVDADDPATADAEIHQDYSANLTADGLSGKRIGVIRTYYGAGSNPAIEALYEASIATLRAQGAAIVDDIEIETEGMYSAEYEVLLYEFKADLNAYLEASGAPIDSLAGLIEYNDTHAATVMPIFGQEIFVEADAKGPLTEEAYVTALESSQADRAVGHRQRHGRA